MNPIWKKLKIKSGQSVVVVNKPRELDLTPFDGNLLFKLVRGASAGLLFVENKKELNAECKNVYDAVGPDGIFWIAYPKKSSGLQTDLTKYDGWDVLKRIGLEGIALVSLDDKWSAFRVRPKSKIAEGRVRREPDKNLTARYVDRERRIVKAPPDVKRAFAANIAARLAFEKLSFTHKKEYVEWIVTAKQEATREKRLRKMMIMLSEGAKNPSDKG